MPVFPLPNAVLFPRARLPLHVFELRYRTLVREALSAERLIAVALLAPGWEKDYLGSPPFLPLGCVGHVDRVEWLPNDCYELELVGQCRVRFGAVTREYPYRACRTEVLEDHPYPEDDPLVQIEKLALWEAWQLHARSREPAPPPDVPGPEAPFGALVNGIATAAPLPAREKFALLGLDSVIERARRLREGLRRRTRQPVRLPGKKEPGSELN